MRLLALMVLFSVLLLGVEDNETKKNIQEQMKKEQKYAQEQKFYRADEYDFKGAEVNEESLKNIPDQPEYNDDFDMDGVYGY